MRILITDRFPQSFVQALREFDADLAYLGESSPDVVRTSLQEAEVLVINSKIKLDSDTLLMAPKLKLVCRAGVGLDHFDLPELARRNIRVVSTPGANAPTVGEQTVGMLLSLLHNIPKANYQVKKFVWEREANRGIELMGKTVGIIGYGNTGMAFAKRLSGFGCKVLAYDKFKTGFSDNWVREAQLAEIFKESNILSLHIPLTEETYHLVDGSFLLKFRNKIVLLNLSRGPIVETAALLEELKSGKVLAAGLDVLENEKIDLPESLGGPNSVQNAILKQLFALEQVLVTPHIGGWSFESLERINLRLIEAVREWYLTQN